MFLLHYIVRFCFTLYFTRIMQYDLDMKLPVSDDLPQSHLQHRRFQFNFSFLFGGWGVGDSKNI